jgi:hypothetical protein
METDRKRHFYVSRNSWAAQAERKIADLLHQLDKRDFTVLNDLPARYGNIDHLVIRHDGVVFIIETKSQRGLVTMKNGRIMINDSTTPHNYFCQVNRNIKWLKKHMPHKQWIVAILAFPNAEVRIRSPIKDVHILGKLQCSDMPFLLR